MKAGRKKNDQKDDKGNWIPSTEQVAFVSNWIEAELNETEIVAKMKGEGLTITLKVISDWWKKIEFIEYLNNQRKIKRAKVLPEIDKSLKNKAIGRNEDVDVPACKLIYELAGEVNADKEDAPSTIVINVTH